MIQLNADIIEAKINSGLHVSTERMKAYRKFKGLPEKLTECPEHQCRLVRGECVECLKDHNRLLRHDVDFGVEAYEEMKGVGNEAAELEAQYADGASDVDDELAKLMAKNKKD